MPLNMRDAIAQYLAYTGGRMPAGGLPGMGGNPAVFGPNPTLGSQATGSPILPSGGGSSMGGQGYSPGPPGPNPGPPVPGSFGETYPPPVPSNLQGYEQLPSGQFLPGDGPSPDQFPPMTPQQPFTPALEPGGGVPGAGNPPIPPFQEPPWMSGQGPRPPDSTPMQVPASGGAGLPPGMSEAQWRQWYFGA